MMNLMIMQMEKGVFINASLLAAGLDIVAKRKHVRFPFQDRSPERRKNG